MSTTRPRHLAHAGLLLALLSPAATAAPALEAIAYVEYDPAAPLDPTKSYGCLADVRLGAGSAATRQLTCTRQVPLAELCGTDDTGQLPADCPFIPGSPGAGSPPTAAQIRNLANALLEHFEGHQPKLNLAAQRLSQGGREAYEMNWQPGAAGASPSIGAWNEASAAERNVRPTALQVDDPDPADSRFGNTTWTNPAADPAEWNALMSSATLDHIARASRNLLATPSAPNPPPAAVTARATAEVARCREASLVLLRSDIEFYLAAAAGGTGTRPSGSVDADCLADPGPPQATSTPPSIPPQTPPAPPPQTQTYTACDGSAHSTQPAANAVTCSTTDPDSSSRRYTACDGSMHSSLSAARAVDCSAPDPDPEPERTKTCWDGSTVGIGESCPAQPTHTACDGSVHSSQSDADAVSCPSTKPTPTTTAKTPTTTSQDRTTDRDTGTGRTKTCSDGSTVAVYESCPVTTKTCPDGSTVGLFEPCPTITTTTTTKKTTTTTTKKTTTYTACDGSVHDTQSDADAVTCRQEKDRLSKTSTTKRSSQDPDDLNECQGGSECPYKDFDSGFLGYF